MTPAMRQILARQPFERKLEQVAQLLTTANALKAARSVSKGDYVKERDALFAGETVNSLFEQATTYGRK
jgi:gamma-glutamyl:cysteine ligase YbdK (ATP-grasp superfamily)